MCNTKGCGGMRWNSHNKSDAFGFAQDQRGVCFFCKGMHSIELMLNLKHDNCISCVESQEKIGIKDVEMRS